MPEEHRYPVEVEYPGRGTVPGVPGFEVLVLNEAADIIVRVDSDILGSGDAVIAMAAHESHALRGLEAEFASRACPRFHGAKSPT